MLQKILAPIIDRILDRLGLEKRLDDLQAKALAELEETRDKAFAELEETRDKALQMMKEAIPEAAGAISREAVTSVFEHTQIDETTNRVTGIFNGIFDRLGLPR